MVYQRSCREETILVIINPAGKPAFVPDTAGEIMTTVGGNAVLEKGGVSVDGGTAVYVKLA